MLKTIAFIGCAATSACALASYSRIECAIMMGTRPDAPTEDALIDKCVIESIAADRQAGIDALLAKQEEDAKKIKAKSQKVIINEFKIYDVDSVGGVDVGGLFSNPNKASAIKYLQLKVTPYNAVGDVVKSSINGQSSLWLKLTGPMKFEDDEKGSYWRAAWYNSTTTCVKIERAMVEYMNGSHTSLDGASLASAIDARVKNDCRVN